MKRATPNLSRVAVQVMPTHAVRAPFVARVPRAGARVPLLEVVEGADAPLRDACTKDAIIRPLTGHNSKAVPALS